jgi:hypothetical protein
MAKKASRRSKAVKVRKSATPGQKEKALIRDLEARSDMVKGGLGTSKRRGYDG